MRNDSILFRTMAGAAVVVVLAAAAAAAWNGVLGKGIPLRGQWDPTVGPVGPRAVTGRDDFLSLEQAHERFGDPLVLFVDARSPDHFEEGHVEGAILVPAVFDEVPEYAPYFEAFEAEIARRIDAKIEADYGIPPDDRFEEMTEIPLELARRDYSVTIILYCNGADCDDSEQLQGKLLDRGFFPVDILFAGFPAWRDAGYPVVLGEGAGAGKPLYPSTPLRMPMFAGMLALTALFATSRFAPRVRSFWSHVGLSLPFRLILGSIFIYAAIHKIADPASFAKAIYGYAILPGGLVNLLAMFLPWMEITAGVLLVAGAFTRGAALCLVVLLAVFIVAIGFNVARGHSFDCGCFQRADAEKPSDPIELLFRDVALALLGLQIIGARTAHPGLARVVARGGASG